MPLEYWTIWLYAGLLSVITGLMYDGQSTDSVDLDYSIAAQVKYLAELMRALSITRAHIIGNSMGGAVALGLAAAAPQQVASLILISAGGTGMYDTKLMEHVARMGRKPQVIRCDNGPEYICAVTLAWAAKRGIRIDFIQPGQPPVSQKKTLKRNFQDSSKPSRSRRY